MVAPTSSADGIERGVSSPSLEILLRLANQFNVSVGQLLMPPQTRSEGPVIGNLGLTPWVCPALERWDWSMVEQLVGCHGMLIRQAVGATIKRGLPEALRPLIR